MRKAWLSFFYVILSIPILYFSYKKMKNPAKILATVWVAAFLLSPSESSAQANNKTKENLMEAIAMPIDSKDTLTDKTYIAVSPENVKDALSQPWFIKKIIEELEKEPELYQIVAEEVWEENIWTFLEWYINAHSVKLSREIAKAINNPELRKAARDWDVDKIQQYFSPQKSDRKDALLWALVIFSLVGLVARAGNESRKELKKELINKIVEAVKNLD